MKICPRCRAPFRLLGIERHSVLDGLAVRTFVCPDCDALQTDLVPLANTELAPVPLKGDHAYVQEIIEQGFDDETLTMVGQSFEAAWTYLVAAGFAAGDETNTALTREALAKCILVFAGLGERDPDRLIKQGLGLLSRSMPSGVAIAAHQRLAALA